MVYNAVLVSCVLQNRTSEEALPQVQTGLWHYCVEESQ